MGEPQQGHCGGWLSQACLLLPHADPMCLWGHYFGEGASPGCQEPLLPQHGEPGHPTSPHIPRRDTACPAMAAAAPSWAICPGQCKAHVLPQCFHPACSQEPCWAEDQGLGSLSSLDAHAWMHKHKSAPNPACSARVRDPHCAGCPGQEDFPAYAPCLLRYPVLRC